MRKLRILFIVLLAGVTAMYGAYRIKGMTGKDASYPEITCDSESISVSIQATQEELKAGVTAQDEKDGDVTDSIIIENLSNFLEKGKRNITYAAFDSDNHITKATRELVYTDYTSPHFALSEPLSFPLGTSIDVLDYVTATDCLDGDLSGRIKINYDTSANMSVAGAYQMELQVTNSAGDSAYLPVEVELYQNDAEYAKKPKVVLSQYLVYTKVNQSIDPNAYLEEIKIAGASRPFIENGASPEDEQALSKTQVTSVSHVDYAVPGTYTVDYSFTTEDGRTGTQKLIVVVEE